MIAFEQMFPGFVASCAKLHGQLVPASLVLLVLSFAFFYWSAPPHPMELFKHVTKLFLIVLLITRADALINQGQAIMESFVRENISARPENVAERYKEKLAATQQSSGDQSWWEMLLSSNFFEAIIYAVLLLVSWLAMALLFYISLFQKVVLLLCWVLSPLLFACFSIPLLTGLAMRHLLRIIGILFWPLGLALAATVTDGLLDLQTDRSMFGSVGGSFRYVVINLLAVASIGLWILFSSVLAPAIMQRLIAGGTESTNLISRGAGLFANAIVPGAISGLATFYHWQSGKWNGFRGSGSATDAHPPLMNLQEPSAPIEPPEPPAADDYTAEKAVRETLEES